MSCLGDSGRARPLAAGTAALLQRLNVAPTQSAGALDLTSGNPIAMLFGHGYALQAVLLWIIFRLMNLFLFAYWPPQVLQLTGMSPAEAARASSCRELGAMLAVLYLGLLIDRHGPGRALALHFAAGNVFIGAIALFPMSYAILVGAIFFAGMTIVRQPDRRQRQRGQALSGTNAHQWDRAGVRHRPFGWHRAPTLGGYFLLMGLPPREIFLSACGFALIAAISAALLVFRGGSLIDDAGATAELG